jgi:hypothetical protein
MYAIIGSHFVSLEGKFLLIALYIVRITLNVIVRQIPLQVKTYCTSIFLYIDWCGRRHVQTFESVFLFRSTRVHPGFQFDSSCSIFRFPCNDLWTVVRLFVCFHLVIVLSEFFDI